jgi:hypothetical protein
MVNLDALRSTHVFKNNIINISSETQSLAEKEGLGELCKVYPVWKPGTGFWPRGLATIGLGVLVLVVTTILIVATLFSSKPPLLNVLSGLTALGVLFLLAGCYLCFSRRIYAHWWVSLWQHGFIYEKKQIRQIFRWDQIERVQGDIVHWRNGPSPILYTYKVRRQDGYEVNLGSVFLDIPDLIDHVLEELVRHLAPQKRSVASLGNAWIFTHINLDRHGVSNGQEMFAWQEIQEFVTKNGTVTLYTKAE